MKDTAASTLVNSSPGTQHDIRVNSLKQAPGVDDPAKMQFNIFAMLWGVAALFHMAHSSVFDKELDFALLSLAALAVIFRPSNATFLALILLQTFDALYRMPFSTNHWVFTAFVNLTILQALVFCVYRSRSFNVDSASWYKVFMPVVKIELLILYFFAVFHKLNSGFFNPSLSCATDLLRAQHVDVLIPLTPTLLAINAYFTIAVELLIPLMLCFKRTRNAAIAIGLFFHGVLSYSTYNAFYDFSSMVFALYFLFADDSLASYVNTWTIHLRDRTHQFLKNVSFTKAIAVIVAMLIFVGILYAANKVLNTYREVNLYFFWTFYSVFVGYIFIRYWIGARQIRSRESILVPFAHASFLAIPLLVFLNGTSPYLGLKTENSYAMFSNLRTEGGISNHFIVPASVQVFGYQRKTVQLLSSTDPHLQQLADEGKGLVMFEFSNYLFEHKVKHVNYVFEGQQEKFTWADRKQDPLIKKNPYVLAKLMRFRPFSLATAQPCLH